MIRAFHILGVVVGTIAANALAGGWVSGGGNLLFDDINPWFLPNTTHVNYCIDVDEDNFGLDVQTVSAKVQESIAYWANELTRADYVALPNTSGGSSYQVQLGTQNFTKVTCDQNPELRFQMGKLDQKQLEFLRDPSRIVGITVRTDYDQEQLRAKGFIYISPEKGPLGLKHPRLVSEVWARDSSVRLKLILIHELGHVFGLQHTNSGSGLMDHSFANALVTRSNLPTLSIRPTVFRHPDQFIAMRSGFADPRWFRTNLALDLPNGWDTVQVKFSNNGSQTTAEFFGGQGGGSSTLQPLGHATLNERVVTHVPRVSLYLTPAQKVFPPDVKLNSDLRVATGEDRTYSGFYEINGSRRSMFASLTSDIMNVGAEDSSGNLYPLVFDAQSWWDYVDLDHAQPENLNR